VLDVTAPGAPQGPVAVARQMDRLMSFITQLTDVAEDIVAQLEDGQEEVGYELRGGGSGRGIEGCTSCLCACASREIPCAVNYVGRLGVGVGRKRGVGEEWRGEEGCGWEGVC